MRHANPLLVLLSVSPLLHAQNDPNAPLQSDQAAQLEQKIAVLAEELEQLRSQGSAAGSGTGQWFERFRLGGYGETHANYEQGPAGGDKFDIHRFVIYTGYRFSDWVQLHSETEFEHGFVEGAEDSGEIVLEQFYVEFELGSGHSLRIGRQLNPLGIVNQRHEPTLFHGVERPALERNVLPSTWFQDGVGLVGRLGQDWSYEVQLATGLNSEGFSDTEGIRGGRLEEQPSLHELALCGRLDWFALPAGAQPLALRLGAGAYSGGADNGNKGVDPDITAQLDTRVDLAALDFEASWRRFALRGVWAQGWIDGAQEINAAFGTNVGTRFGGWYLEASTEVLPTAWRRGKLEQADLQVFARYEDFDTQQEQPSNAADSPAAERRELTFGLSFHPLRDVVLKADYQIRESEADTELANLLNFGLGFRL